MKKKILFISNTAIFSRFNLPYMRWFKQQGWQIDYVSNGDMIIPDCDNQYAIRINRSPYNCNNITAYKELKKILLNEYDLIHCHTPMGGVLGRMAAKNIHTKAKVLYTAHGFHFYKGAPVINWLLYYPMEKYLAKYTDVIITINEEDYNIAKRKFNLCNNICKINGVGIDLEKFMPCDKENKRQLRNKFELKENDFVILYVAEFIDRKNHKMLINSMERLNSKIKNLKIIFAGNGFLLKKYKEIIKKKKLTETVLFLGYRNDIEQLCNIADLGISTSKQEGLPINILEYIASGLPVVCSRIRGHIDIVTNKRNGLLFGLNNINQMIDSIFELQNNANLRNTIIHNNLEDREKYSVNNLIQKTAEIYIQYMSEQTK